MTTPIMTRDLSQQFVLAQSAVSSVITLSSGILALSVTFSQKLATNASAAQKSLLQDSWLCFLLSILFGIISLCVLVGLVQGGKLSTREWELRIPWGIEILAFLAGISMLAYFAHQTL
jgi:hypothetical protein